MSANAAANAAEAPKSPGIVKKAASTVAKPKVQPKPAAKPVSTTAPVETPLKVSTPAPVETPKPAPDNDSNPFSIFGWGA